MEIKDICILYILNYMIIEDEYYDRNIIHTLEEEYRMIEYFGIICTKEQFNRNKISIIEKKQRVSNYSKILFLKEQFNRNKISIILQKQLIAKYINFVDTIEQLNRTKLLVFEDDQNKTYYSCFVFISEQLNRNSILLLEEKQYDESLVVFFEEHKNIENMIYDENLYKFIENNKILENYDLSDILDDEKSSYFDDGSSTSTLSPKNKKKIKKNTESFSNENDEKYTYSKDFIGMRNSNIEKIHELVTNYDYKKNAKYMDNLFEYQKVHFITLERTLLKNNLILDASDTGTGKTYVILSIVKKHKLRALVICPKSMISTWFEVAEYLGINLYGVSNYECFSRGNYYDRDMKKHKSLYFKKNIDIKNEVEYVTYDIKFPNNFMIIYDEAHRCKKYNTINSKVIQSCKRNKNKLALLSATIIDKIEHFKPFGFIFDLYKDVGSFTKWINDAYKKSIISETLKEKVDDKKIKLIIINHYLFPEYGSRMKINDLSDIFKNNDIKAICYKCKDFEEINDEYNKINTAMKKLKNRSSKISLKDIMKARQNIETYKIPIIEKEIKKLIKKGKSVVVFVNFVKTAHTLCEQFNTNCIIIGGQTFDIRNENIKKFQNNESNIIICTAQSGSTGLSLHDIHGNHPRASIISPSYSGTELTQTLGRIHRANAKTHSEQYIIYCANTCEEKVAAIVTDKIENIRTINDGDLFPNIIKKEIVCISNLTK